MGDLAVGIFGFLVLVGFFGFRMMEFKVGKGGWRLGLLGEEGYSF